MLNPGMRSDLARARHLGSARSGTGHFWLQRMTAVINPFVVFGFLAILVSLSGAGYEETVRTLRSPVVAIVMLLAILNISAHMRTGMQVIVEDYIHEEPTKLVLFIANTAFTAVVALTAAFAVLKLSFGG